MTALLLAAAGLLTLGPSTARGLDASEGKTVKVKVSFTGDDDNDESLTSVATPTVSAAPNTRPPERRASSALHKSGRR